MPTPAGRGRRCSRAPRQTASSATGGERRGLPTRRANLGRSWGSISPSGAAWRTARCASWWTAGTRARRQRARRSDDLNRRSLRHAPPTGHPRPRARRRNRPCANFSPRGQRSRLPRAAEPVPLVHRRVLGPPEHHDDGVPAADRRRARRSQLCWRRPRPPLPPRSRRVGPVLVARATGSRAVQDDPALRPDRPRVAGRGHGRLRATPGRARPTTRTLLPPRPQSRARRLTVQRAPLLQPLLLLPGAPRPRAAASPPSRVGPFQAATLAALHGERRIAHVIKEILDARSLRAGGETTYAGGRHVARGQTRCHHWRLPWHWSGDCVEAGREPRRSEEHTSELQSPCNLVCRLLLEKKKKKKAEK